MKHVTILDNTTKFTKVKWMEIQWTDLKQKYGTKDTKIFKTPFADRSEGLFTLTGTAVIYSINVMFSYCTLSITLNIDR